MNAPLQFIVSRMDSPIGEMLLLSDNEGNLRAVDWVDCETRMRRLLRRQYSEGGFNLATGETPRPFAEAFTRYFAGELSALNHLPVATAGTSFQRCVWSALREIPCRTTTTYAKLAQGIGKPAAIRAVGLANGSNPLSVIVPCHRVIGSNGSLTGYGGGVHRKQWLLKHESEENIVAELQCRAIS